MRAWKIAAALWAVAWLAGCGGGNDGDGCEAGRCAQTESGRVRGEADGQVLAFRGIPYAAAPVGPLRFRPPQQAPAWQGVRDGSRYRAACPQIEDPLEGYAVDGVPVHNTLTDSDEQFHETEDCLHVNVWTPALDNARRPVMLFIHGGAFQVGTAANAFYTGRHLAERDVVVMTINYRLGLFGFLELGMLDPAYAGSGNNGLRDQVAALQWARRNAAAFGGDADNITVFGESAGSMSVSALLATASPERLFRRAIGQSGGPNLLHHRAFRENATRVVLEFGPRKTLADLLGASTRELLMQQQSAIWNYELGDSLFAPFRDDALIIGDPYELIAGGNAKAVDLMVGATQDEMGYWAMYDSQLRNLFVQDNDFGEPVHLVSEAKRSVIDAALFPRSLRGIYADWIAARGAPLAGRTLDETIELAQDHDFMMIQPMTRLAEKQARHNANTYLYRFQWKVPRALLASDAEDLGAVHALELPFMFGTLDLDEKTAPGAPRVLADPAQRAQARALSDAMVSAWTNFARSGNPNGVGVPTWPAYDLATRPTLAWRNDAVGNIVSEAVGDPDADLRLAWASWDFPLYDWPLP